MASEIKYNYELLNKFFISIFLLSNLKKYILSKPLKESNYFAGANTTFSSISAPGA
jgi:hypothetical protein